MAALVNPITSEGDYDVLTGHHKVQIMCDGDFDGGKVEIYAINPSSGAEILLECGTFTEDFETAYVGNADRTLRFKISGTDSNSPTLNFYKGAIYD